ARPGHGVAGALAPGLPPFDSWLLGTRRRFAPRRPPGARQEGWPRAGDGLVSAREEALLVEGLALAPPVGDRPPPPRRPRPQRPLLAVLLLPAGQPRLGLRGRPQQQARRLGEGPLQVGVADLVPAGALLLAGRLVGTADQAGVGEELPRGGEA